VDLFRRKPNPVEVVRRALAGSDAESNLHTAIDAVVAPEAWQSLRSSRGERYSTFGHFAVDSTSHGLGANNFPAVRELRRALIDRGHFGPLTEVLELCVRPPGRPPKNLTQGESFLRFYRVANSVTSIDRILLTLKKRFPDLFQNVVRGVMKPREAARVAGLISESASRRFGVCDIEGVAQLSNRAQTQLVLEMFPRLCLEAQCTFLSRIIEPRLGGDLAKCWRTSLNNQNPT